jgi:hypothetical protein
LVVVRAVRRDRGFVAKRPIPRADLHFSSAEDDLTRDRPGSGRDARGVVRVPRAADRRSIRFKHRLETFQAGPTASSISSARVSTRRSMRGRWRWRGESTWCDRSTVRDSRFMAPPAGGLFALA